MRKHQNEKNYEVTETRIPESDLSCFRRFDLKVATNISFDKTSLIAFKEMSKDDTNKHLYVILHRNGSAKLVHFWAFNIITKDQLNPADMNEIFKMIYN